MQEKMDLEEEVTEEAPTVTSVVNVEKSPCPGHGRSPAVFRLLIHLHGASQPDVNLANGDRVSSPTASFIHPFGEGDDQKNHLANTQECGSREPEEQMEIRTKHTKTDNEVLESPFHLKEQSLSARAIILLLILFITLGVIVIFMIACHVYLEVKRSWNLDTCVNGLVKHCFVGTRNPPV